MNNKRVWGALCALCLVMAGAQAQDLAPWDFGSLRSSRDCDSQSRSNFMRLMAYQAVENRRIDSMSIPPAQKRQLGYDVYRVVQDRIRDEEQMAEQCRQYFQAKE